LFLSPRGRQHPPYAACQSRHPQPAHVPVDARHGLGSDVRSLRLFVEHWLETDAMDVVATLLDTQRAFDGVAEDYDRSNTENRILSAMRARVRQTVERFVPVGSRLLDL